MNSSKWDRIESLCQAALDLEPGQRANFLDEACAGDETLRQEVESLLAYEEPARQFIETPPGHIAAEMLASKQTENLSGHYIGHYKLLNIIGKGGMGEVYLAEDMRLGRKIAIKILPREFTTDQDRMRRFKREAQAASSLNDPHILTVYDVGEDRGLHFIATEFIEGQTLRRKLIRSKKIELPDALNIAIQVALALTKAHEADIVHRDVKPENIMVLRDGLVKVLDFGLAKLIDLRAAETEREAPVDEETETAIGVVMGTVTYMSPEQARGKRVDARSDIFSFGIVLYEMITGIVPFSGETDSDKLACLLERDPPPLMQNMPTASPELERIIIKALRKNRDERYQTIKDLGLDLKYLQEDLHTGRGNQQDKRDPYAAPIRQATAIKILADNIKTHKKASALTMLIVVISALLVVWVIMKSKTLSMSTTAITNTTQEQPPIVSSILPDSPFDIIGDQSLSVSGSGFQDGLTVNITFPNGGTGKLSGSQIQSLNPTSFTLLVDFNGNPGRYTTQVINPNGLSSDPFTFVAQHKLLDPIIDSILPSNPPANKEEQNIIVYGYNFQVGLTVNVTFPNGQKSVLKDRQIPSRTPNSFHMLIYFNGDRGRYKIQVLNPNGRKSNTFTFKIG